MKNKEQIRQEFWADINRRVCERKSIEYLATYEDFKDKCGNAKEAETYEQLKLKI